MINVEVSRNNNENSLSTLRRFTKRVQGAGILPKVRSLRYTERDLSHYKTKQRTLKSLKRRQEIAELIKMGKMPEKNSRYGGNK
jgi:ribosomal protein S21